MREKKEDTEMEKKRVKQEDREKEEEKVQYRILRTKKRGGRGQRAIDGDEYEEEMKRGEEGRRLQE